MIKSLWQLLSSGYSDIRSLHWPYAVPITSRCHLIDQVLTRTSAGANLREHADVHGQALRWRLVLQTLRPLYEADAGGQGFPQLQAAKVILAAKPV